MTAEDLSNRQSLYRALIVIVCVLVALLVVCAALLWQPGGYLVDVGGTPLTDKAGHYLSRPRSSSDVVAIVGSMTTFLGTILGTYFGVNVGSQAAQAANASAQTANETAKVASENAVQVLATAKNQTDAAQDDVKVMKVAKDKQEDAIRETLTWIQQAVPNLPADSSSGANTHAGPTGVGWWDGRATT
ncbi:hypothetical protein HN018_19415 [Lichenicola cladoniae]|uniref:Uncharacterized protein n=1 Tax=Lichenicola cladoniae TaxID=1484109 RepID=A0A6M8HU93_9PROT|nr:hypothetical protein [Lichenicola cladoniae]NPD69986.1 hypothetical protein [Acetobacteraceae bacterium]QKE91912.1 hypothetical protein HN018_19415 [Lichenicola cladoniae]